MLTVTQVLSGAFTAYIFYSVWSLYVMYAPSSCQQSSETYCLASYLERNPLLPLQLTVHTSTNERFSKSTKIWTSKSFYADDEFEELVEVNVPSITRHNGSLYAMVLLNELTSDSLKDWTMKQICRLTTFAVPQASTFNLIGNSTETKNISKVPETHWNSKLLINIVNDKISLNRYNLPAEIASYMMLYNNKEYLPILFIDEMAIRLKDLVPLNASSSQMPLRIIYKPMSIGKLRLWVNMKHSLLFFNQLGFSEKDIDEVKNIFVDTNLYLLLLTFFVSAFHLLFDFLAFKNDINFWRNRKDMVGLSSRTMLWRCFSTFIIFFYLLDQQTSLLVLGPSGIGLIIEVWKTTKAFKIKVKWNSYIPTLEFGHSKKNEEETEAFDAQAMKWLSYLLYPLVLCGAVYSLLYTPHKSWYSWTIESMANGVYAFGFIFMLPQLFINYKLKSVAHLPWKAFTYKAFNTFIDDVFAFIITMPTTHRLACFRDDVVFVIYLYQRWLYPVDKKRVNEFGQSFDGDTAAETKSPTKESNDNPPRNAKRIKKEN
ncbi:hypothetical protein HELRODRAFT_108202 [Helobdella robusta]|uniref:Lipid scramblase CLPTM1L n=1 Tax=Helobdella robusta TaxID=6412 RepID=T1EEG8_HELRO|nr:hypothetical protein HELRODRAFT_108202 [Helobdella robusta]ESN92969.1 hypothetical protein HELRODRAFT_108202 [Helobdella robusta]